MLLPGLLKQYDQLSSCLVVMLNENDIFNNILKEHIKMHVIIIFLRYIFFAYASRRGRV